MPLVLNHGSKLPLLQMLPTESLDMMGERHALAFCQCPELREQVECCMLELDHHAGSTLGKATPLLEVCLKFSGPVQCYAELGKMRESSFHRWNE